MSTKKNNAHRAKILTWGNKQKKGEAAQLQQAAVGNGSHFAAPSAGESHQQAVPQHSKHAHIKITGASGEMPKVPVRIHAVSVDQYSRYNERYGTGQPAEKGASARVGGFSTTAVSGQPAYSWTPFLVYGAISIAAILIWIICAKLYDVPLPVPGDPVLTLAVALLCLIVVAGFVVIALTVSMTKRSDDSLKTSDVVASALLKGSLAMVASVVVWIAALYVVTTLVV